MPFDYDISTDAGKVRLLCVDTDSEYPIFQDDEIDAFLSLESGNIRRAAALALETLASSENLIQKAIRISNLSTNGPAVAAEFRARAKGLRDQADAAEAREDGAAFDWAEYSFEPFGVRERIWNQGLRE